MINEAWYLQRYQSRHDAVQLVIDVLSIYLYPLDKHTLFDAVNLLTSLPRPELEDILLDLREQELLQMNVNGHYNLPPALSFQLLPLNIVRPEYQPVVDRTGRAVHAFYSVSARLQELQQLLVAWFTGDRYLLAPPIRRMELELNEYQPWLSYLLFFPAYDGLLKLFSEPAMDNIFSFAIKYHLLQLPPMEELLALQTRSDARFPELQLLQGDLHTPLGDASADELFGKALVTLYEGNPAAALIAFDKGIKRQRQQDKKNTLPVSPLFAFYYALTLTLLPGEKSNPVIQKLLTAYERKIFPAVTPAICLLHLHAGRKEKAESLLLLLLERNEQPLLSYLSVIALQLLHPRSKLLITFRVQADVLLRRGMEHHYRLLTYEYLYLFRDAGYAGYAPAFTAAGAVIRYEPVLSQIRLTADWERLLNTLLTPDDAGGKAKPVPVHRLIYLVDFDHYKLQPVAQTANPDGSWSAGRNVPLKKLKEGRAEAMTDQDQRISTTIQKDHFYNHDGEAFSFDSRVWEELAGHPYLFLEDNPAVPVEIVKGTPELLVNFNGKGYTFTVNINDYSSELVFVKETPTRLKIIRLTPQQRKVLQTLAQVPVVPAEGREKLMQVLKSIGAHLTVHSELGDGSLNIRKREGDARIVIQLLPFGAGIKAGLFVKPFTIDPPYCKAGAGAAHIIGISNGERWQANRNLEEEKANETRLLELIQQIVPQELVADTLVFEDPADCLELLDLIHAHPDLVRAEWPEGERYHVKDQVNFSHVALSLKEKGHWFLCDGEIRVDENLVLTFRELLDTKRIVKKRFLALDNGEFLSLTADLRKRLNELADIAIQGPQGLSIPRYAASMLDDLLLQAGQAEVDEAWRAFIHKRDTAMDLHPEIPVTLQTTLRPYQEEGFRWMAHLAAWGAGACLADDMGLGKTVQAIALLLYRAADGPALVVSPASVLPNWVNELSRFAPSLNIVELQPGKRAALIKNAGAFDVVVTTYGILQAEAQLFAGAHWSTAVLDEAHTIKNYQTKTSKAAMALQADFRLMLTGTPIQNHMGEIWNLFNFLNPGLLGSLDHFNEQFVFPSVRNPESTVKQHLRRLLAPFLLRRTKTAVLEELPSKTEITRLVELSHEEMSFYEAIRRKAIEALAVPEENLGRRQMKALAEISRLRMAACHPQLVDGESGITSSKLNVFLEIVQELISNNHRALVFSQFVRHLELVKTALEQRGIDCLYLDGATPIPQRERLVRDFQSGRGQLFLISLKAGGVGLNLTAADYVVHLDPWWNPAIEEQASDRAHRIGQTRPVTIYRLVAKQTIEEKIIALHHSKRDLADRLLEGSDQSGRLSAEELMDLISVGY
ncbi:DEAD/DEAH box helicase [Chitinophaga qingshengii]|uniref:DEAD/DEAH box helicase family protein n=1 Tax=Chitinophaga qingshengii TaxID=1569794 RepID=A0ABR7TQB1_9BACT|nr:SNF2-related protein [Chitinophaga qingshengii]MBC9931783.1 DEAD/DEAH box helicase family protein [Chitinophaga qingshengii]